MMDVELIGEIKYTKLNKIGELTIYSPIES